MHHPRMLLILLTLLPLAFSDLKFVAAGNGPKKSDPANKQPETPTGTIKATQLDSTLTYSIGERPDEHAKSYLNKQLAVKSEQLEKEVQQLQDEAKGLSGKERRIANNKLKLLKAESKAAKQRIKAGAGLGWLEDLPTRDDVGKRDIDGTFLLMVTVTVEKIVDDHTFIGLTSRVPALSNQEIKRHVVFSGFDTASLNGARSVLIVGLTKIAGTSSVAFEESNANRTRKFDADLLVLEPVLE